MTIRNGVEAFDQAIKEGRLSLDETSPRYAGHWMYIYDDDSGVPQFKNIETRRYLRD